MTDPLRRIRRLLAPRYEIDRVVRAGRTTLLAGRDRGERVTIKVLSPALTALLETERLLRALAQPMPFTEGLTVRRDAGMIEGSVYYVEPEPGGVSVGDKLRAHGPAPLAEVVRIVGEVAASLASAHTGGIVHGGVAPHRVMLTGSGTTLTDVGVDLAILDAWRDPAADLDEVIDAPEYLAPELRCRSVADHCADIYGLGALGWALVTGYPPPRDGALGPETPARLERCETGAALALILRRCLHEDPTARWQSWPAVTEQLDPLLDEVGPRTVEHASARVGPYRILRPHGEGGMGCVYVAEQDEPVTRRVALKIIKLGMDTREVLARFEVERQVMAMMDHPHIARIFEAGATETGRPYFAMELIEGMPITEYCDTYRLTIPERLALFIPVCRAVQHAHQKGVIHRDLKPSNILITVEDGRAVPKIIDFGVAKAIGSRLTERSLITQHGQLIGTPEYMSPEQAAMSPLDVDACSDIYSLGVVLYELLVDALPFDPRAVSADPAEMRRVIRETEPPRPSERFDGLSRRRPEIAAARRIDPPGLRRRLATDLDWIVLRALEKDRTRRYETPTDLARDLERHLRHEPVTARPPTTLYRLRKLARRHRVAVASTSLVAAGVLAALFTTTALLIRTRAAERAAATEAATARQVSEFLEGLFTAADPGETAGEQVTARALLDRGAGQLDEQLPDQPDIRRRLLRTMGRAYRGLGEYDRAAETLERAATAGGDDHADPATDGALRMDLSSVYRLQGRFDEAEQAGLAAVELLETAYGPTDRRLAAALYGLASLYDRTGRYAESASIVQRVVEIDEQVLDPDDPELAKDLSQLGITLFRQGEIDSAIPIFERSLSIRRNAHGAVHPDVATGLSHLSTIYEKAGRYAEAESLAVQSVTTWETIHGPDHPEVAFALSNLAALYATQGEFAPAVPVVERALRIAEQTFGPEHAEVAWNLQGLGRLYTELGRFAAADSALRRALVIGETTLGTNHPELANTLMNQAALEIRRHRYAEAEPPLQRALAIQRSALGEDHPVVGETLHQLADLRVLQDRLGEAERLFSLAMNIQRAALPPDHPQLAATIEDYAALLRRTGKTEEADDVLQIARSNR